MKRTFYFDKNFILAFVIILTSWIVNWVYLLSFFSNELSFANGYTFFLAAAYGAVGDSFGGIVITLSPIIIIFGVLSLFHDKISSSFFQNELLRESYRHFCFRELRTIYFKMLFLFPLISAFFFFFSLVIFGTKPVFSSFSLLADFIIGTWAPYPLLCILLYFVLICIFSLIVINFGLIVARFVKNKSLWLVVTFILFYWYNMIISTLCIEKLSVYNLYFLMAPKSSSFFEHFFFGIIHFIISSIVLIIVYRKKESLVLKYN